MFRDCNKSPKIATVKIKWKRGKKRKKAKERVYRGRGNKKKRHMITTPVV